MIICTTVSALQKARAATGIVASDWGFVPTMGALHQGHIALLKTSQQQCRLSMVSIFVNPAQFNDAADFEKYPRTTEADIALLEAVGCQLLFLPGPSEVYPPALDLPTYYPLGRLESLLEGQYRPGHYQGVCRVMHRLLALVQPASLFMGQKDYQQCMVVKKLMADHGLNARFVMVPTIREPDGLAMSSRNRRLNAEERIKAGRIYHEMKKIAEAGSAKDYRLLEKEAADNLLAAGFSAVDYVCIADASTLEPCENGKSYPARVCLVAAFMGEVRLIDNLPLD